MKQQRTKELLTTLVQRNRSVQLVIVEKSSSMEEVKKRLLVVNANRKGVAVMVKKVNTRMSLLESLHAAVSVSKRKEGYMRCCCCIIGRIAREYAVNWWERERWGRLSEVREGR